MSKSRIRAAIERIDRKVDSAAVVMSGMREDLILVRDALTETDERIKALERMPQGAQRSKCDVCGYTYGTHRAGCPEGEE